MVPKYAVATRREPSAELATALQARELPSFDQVAPPSVERWMEPPLVTAVILVPSDDVAAPLHA